jgi:hypothetical protein
MYCNKHTKYDACEELTKASGIIWQIDYSEMFGKVCRLVYELLVAKNRSIIVSLSSTGTADLYVVSLAISIPIKLIGNSKAAGATLVNLLYCPLISSNFKSTKKLAPLYTILLLHNCVCQPRVSLCFLFFDKI